MKISLDIRERALIEEIEHDSTFSHTIVKEQLDLGDILIYDDDDNLKLIIERKTPSDLMSSIKDGRYSEQSYRLNGHPVHNHNIVYLIEGNFNSHKDSSVILSAMVSIFYHKGFSIWQSSNMKMTKQLIEKFASKIGKELGKKESYYASENNKESDYVSCIKSTKKENITVDNIHEIMLCQIPNVSATIAKVIINKYETIFKLKSHMEEDMTCLSNIKYITSTDKERKISSLAISNIVKYL